MSPLQLEYTRRRIAGRALLLLTLSLSIHRVASAAPIAGAVGWDYTQGAAHQITRGALAVGVARLGPFEATLAGTRFDDSVVGLGTGGIAGLGAPLAPFVSAQLTASRYVGDAGYRSWRVKAGPQLDLPGGSHVLVAWSRTGVDAGDHADGAVLESTLPLIPALAARVNGAIGENADGRRASEATAGLSWRAAQHLQLLGDMGWARNGGTSLTQTAPPRSVLGGLLGVGPQPSSTSNETQVDDVTARVGVRLLFP